VKTGESTRWMHGRRIGARRVVLAVVIGVAVSIAPPATVAQATDALPILWEAGGLDAGSTGAGQASRIAVDAGGTLAVVSGPSGGSGLAVTSYTSTGEVRWQSVVYPSVGTFLGDWVAAAPNGDVVAVGHNISGSSGNPIGITMVRYDSDGSLQWRVDIARTLPSVGRLIVDGAGNAYLAFNSIGDGHDIQVHKYSPAGVLLWSQLVSTGFFSNDIAASLALSPDGADVVVTGDVLGGATWTTVSFDAATGTRRWLVSAGEGIAARDVVVDATRVYVAGMGNVGITGYLSVIAYDRATGARLWRTDTKPADAVGAAGLWLTLAPDGSLVTTGQASRGFLDWYTVALDTSGSVRWEAVRDGGLNTDEIPAGVLVLADGTSVVTGRGGPNLPGNFIPGVTAGYSSTGVLLWEGFSPFATVWGVALPGGDVCTTGGYDAYVSCFRPSGGDGNLPPVATATAVPESGAAPLTVDFDASGSHDPDGSIVSWAWTFGDGGTGAGSTVRHVYETAGTYTATVTVTDDVGAADTASVVVSATGGGLMHVADLDGSAASSGSRNWTATVTVTIRDAAGVAVPGATVSGTWRRGTVATCTTTTGGTCSMATAAKGRNEVFTVVALTHAALTYDPSANTDPDGDSTGTVITISRP
jgi:PKD repeat protein